ncbi:MAG: glycoside hydrolase family 99-like domain-containing protein [Anaerolineae bacterium]|nr:glycoside hydrolase family 99-like domain-containing protein [Anaerolineae bacterium]
MPRWFAALVRCASGLAGLLVACESATIPPPLPATEPAPIASPVPAATELPVLLPVPYQRQMGSTVDRDAILVGAYWYPWYGIERHWDEGYLGTPTLGEYDMTRPEVIDRHIDWATGYGVDFFIASWWGPGSFEDQVLRTALPAASLCDEMRFAVLYETMGQLEMRGGRVDLTDPANRDQLLADVRYLAETYFRRPTYLTIQGRPVLFVYLTRVFAGDVEGAFQDVRNAVRETTGQDVFIVGDQVYWHAPRVAEVLPYDAVTAYNMHTSVPTIADGFAGYVLGQYARWADVCAEAGVAFIPGVLPGFDDSAVRPQARHPPIPRSLELFGEQLGGALDMVDPRVPILTITSWNEWHEYTSIEPAHEYGEAYLQLLRQALDEHASTP